MVGDKLLFLLLSANTGEGYDPHLDERLFYTYSILFHARILVMFVYCIYLHLYRHPHPIIPTYLDALTLFLLAEKVVMVSPFGKCEFSDNSFLSTINSSKLGNKSMP